MKKNASILKACRVTTQKLLYFLVFLASVLRGAYFAAPTIGNEWSISLMSAYYPVVLTGKGIYFKKGICPRGSFNNYGDKMGSEKCPGWVR